MADEAGVGSGISTNSWPVGVIYTALALTKMANLTGPDEIAAVYRKMHKTVNEAHSGKY